MDETEIEKNEEDTLEEEIDQFELD